MTTSLHTDVSGWATRLNAEDVARYTGSGAWRNVTLAETARRQAGQDAQRIAVIEHNRSATFGTLLAQASQPTATFQARGLRAGGVISFQLPNWIETMVINTAACIAGLVVNPIVPIYREAEVRYILRDARPKLFFIHGRDRSGNRVLGHHRHGRGVDALAGHASAKWHGATSGFPAIPGTMIFRKRPWSSSWR